MSRISTEHRIIRMKRIYLRQREETMPNLSWLDPFVSFMKDLIKRLEKKVSKSLLLSYWKKMSSYRNSEEKMQKFFKKGCFLTLFTNFKNAEISRISQFLCYQSYQLERSTHLSPQFTGHKRIWKNFKNFVTEKCHFTLKSGIVSRKFK